MTRVIVHIEWRPELDPETSSETREEQWASLVAPLFERVSALGGRVIGWGQRSLTTDFSWDGLYDAIDFLVDASLAPELAGGMCHGAPQVIFDAGRAALCVGPEMLQATQLAQLARPGEVLVSPEIVEESDGRLGVSAEVGERPGRINIPAWILNPQEPLLESAAPGPASDFEGLQLVPAERRTHPPSSRSPESVRVRQVDRLVSSAEAIGDAVSAVFPPELTTALRKRDENSLHELARSVRAKNALESAERLDAIAELAAGKAGEALRRLRKSKENSMSENPSTRCRAALALAVALSSAGRPYEAALEGLDGIARAREGQDGVGEKACARFLAQLSKNFHDEGSALRWKELGLA